MSELLDTVPAIVRLDAEPHSPRLALTLKRALDIAIAVPVLLVLAPVFLLVVALVRLDSPGPALFRQTRVGVGGRRFNIVKFRTMVVDAEAILSSDPALLALHHANNFKLPVDLDPRVTRVGRWLRRLSVDELPQLWNVVRGEMTLVGVRPIEPEQVSVLYGVRERDYLATRPGITGFWQVNGRSMVTDNDRAHLDLYYLDNWSLWLDVRILLKTVPAVLMRHGAY